LLSVRGSQIPGVYTVSPDIFGMNIEFFLTKSSHAPSRKHQIAGSQVSLELQVLSREMFHAIPLVPCIWRWLVKFWKICGALPFVNCSFRTVNM